MANEIPFYWKRYLPIFPAYLPLSCDDPYDMQKAFLKLNTHVESVIISSFSLV